jgi:hypothetical protein
MVVTVREVFVDPVDGNLSREPENSGGVQAAGSGPSGAAGRPRWTALVVTGIVVLTVGGFALSRDYGVPSVSPPSELEEVAARLPPPGTVSPAADPTNDPTDSIDWVYLDWIDQVIELRTSRDGALLALSHGGLARLDHSNEWTVINLDGLPEGFGIDRGPGRLLSHVASGPDGGLWLTGESHSPEEDREFGGTLLWDARVVWWAARLDCLKSCSWTVFTSNDFPELLNGLDDVVISEDGTLYASAGGNLLLEFDGSDWKSHNVPTGWSVPASSPWSESLAIGPDGVVWAAVREKGVFAFDGESFARHTTNDGLPSNNVFQVAASADGTIWAATSTSFIRRAPGGIATFDGTSWTTLTTADGLLSDHSVIVTGADASIWAIHREGWPLGFSRFDGTGWTTYPLSIGLEDVGGSAAVGPDGSLWMATWDGLISFDGTASTIHPSPFVQPDGSIRFTPFRWGIILDDDDPGVHTVFMEVDARPLTGGEIEDVSGRLIWDETVVELCQIGIDRPDGFLYVGDIFQTTEGCGRNPTAMQDAFDEFGLPETACVTVTVEGIDHEYCAPLPMVIDGSVGSEPGTVTVVLDGLEGFAGLDVGAWVVAIDPSDEWIAFAHLYRHFTPVVHVS